MSKAQTEIFGLVIIVLIISLGLLFSIILLTKPPTSNTQQIKESIQATNFLNTMLGTTTQGCAGRTMRELLQDCAVSGDTWATAAFCDDRITNTCQKFNDVSSTMLADTLGTWGRTYAFIVNGTRAAERLSLSPNACTSEREGATRPEKIRTGLDVTLTLYIC